MRILAITNLYPRPARPGRAPFNRQQFRALAAEHELAVIAPVPWTEELDDRLRRRPVPRRHREPDGVEVSNPRFLFPPRALGHLYGPLLLAGIAPEARRLAREFRPDVVLASWAHPDGWAAVRVAAEVGVPCVTKVVGSDVLVAAHPRRRRRRAATAEGLGAADAVVAVSRDLAGRVVAMGVAPGRVHVVPEGLDRGLFRPGDRAEARRRLGLGDGPPIVLFVGNLLLSKGAGVLIEAIAELRRRGRPVRCWLVGAGRDGRRLRGLARRLGLAGAVKFAGPRPLAELPGWYHACDAVALPSYSEGIPNVLREAVACARPFVATRVGGIPEVADGTSCPLVDPGRPDQLAEALWRTLSRGPDAAPPVDASIGWGESARALAAVLARAIADRADGRAGPGTPAAARGTAR